jgi:fucose permease
MSTFPEIAEGDEAIPLKRLLTSVSFLLVCVGVFLVGATEMTPTIWLPTLAEEIMGFPRWVSGSSLVAMNFMFIAGRQLAAGKYGSKINPMALVGGCGIATSTAIVAAAYIPESHIALIAGVMIGLTVAPMIPCVFGVAADVHPNAGTVMFAIFSICGNGGGSFMPWVVGLVADSLSLRDAFAICSVAGVLAAVVMAILWKHVQAAKNVMNVAKSDLADALKAEGGLDPMSPTSECAGDTPRHSALEIECRT